MKIFFLALLLCFSLHVHALQFTVVGPCRPDPILNIQTTTQVTNLGALTIAVLNKNQIPVLGDSNGIIMIANSPVGDAAIENLPNHGFRLYGWCVSVDNVLPNQSPNYVRIESSTQSIKWFYAYSLNDNGSWKDYCTPAYLAHSLPVCQ